MGTLQHIPGLWLDVTRTLTRCGRGAPTGIDRVELEYLDAFLAAGCRHFLCRTTRGYLLLDDQGAMQLRALAHGDVRLGRADLFSRLTCRGRRPRHKAEAVLRSVAVDRCRPSRLRDMVARHGAQHTTYVNVGHSNLSYVTFSAFSAYPECELVVLIHDLIPITHPDLVADTQPANFAGRIERVRQHATLVICNSAVTDADLAYHWRDAPNQPRRVISHLGVSPQKRYVRRRPRPGHFVMLGTLEPRKNHALIVECWEMLATELAPDIMPELHIIGAFGWNVEALVAKLRHHPLKDRSIFVHGTLPDADVAEHLFLADALLFPSIAEGYGFPPFEAAIAGTVSICSDLPIFRETLGDCAVYVKNLETHQWKEKIQQHISTKGSIPDLSKLKIPTWQEHFEIVAQSVLSHHNGGRR